MRAYIATRDTIALNEALEQDTGETVVVLERDKQYTQVQDPETLEWSTVFAGWGEPYEVERPVLAGGAVLLASSFDWRFLLVSSTAVGIDALSSLPDTLVLATLSDDVDLDEDAPQALRDALASWFASHRPRGFDARFSSRFLRAAPAPDTQLATTRRDAVHALVRHFRASFTVGIDSIRDYN